MKIVLLSTPAKGQGYCRWQFSSERERGRILRFLHCDAKLTGQHISKLRVARHKQNILLIVTNRSTSTWTKQKPYLTLIDVDFKLHCLNLEGLCETRGFSPEDFSFFA